MNETRVSKTVFSYLKMFSSCVFANMHFTLSCRLGLTSCHSHLSCQLLKAKMPHKSFLSEDQSVNRMYLGYLEKNKPEVFKRNQDIMRYIAKQGQ